MKCGLIFGSFNPIHNGHLKIAQEAIKQKIVDRVVFVPAKQNPFKPAYEVLDVDRVNIISLAVSDYDSISYNLIEFTDSVSSTKTYDVYNAIKNINNGLEDLVIICGKDTYDEIPIWYKGSELLKENFYIFDREISDISSSQIREKIKSGEDFKNLVPEIVYKYIKEHNLYANTTKTERIKTK